MHVDMDGIFIKSLSVELHLVLQYTDRPLQKLCVVPQEFEKFKASLQLSKSCRCNVGSREGCHQAN